VLTLFDDTTGSELASETLQSGLEDTVSICVAADHCHQIVVSDGDYPNEVSWSAEDEEGNELASGGAGETVSLCDDADANNDGAADISCDDSEAKLILTLSDFYGDGWNGAVLTLFDDTTGSELASETLQSGLEDTVSICVAADHCHQIVVSDGDYPNEVSWSAEDEEGNELASGGAGETVSLCDDAGYNDDDVGGYTGDCYSGCSTCDSSGYEDCITCSDGSVPVDEDGDGYGYCTDDGLVDDVLGACPETCSYGYSCDYWIDYDPTQTCADLENAPWFCDCTGCNCGSLGCVDLPGDTSGTTWENSYGNGCDSIFNDDLNGWCNYYGNNNFNGEGSANEKCCACGGGATGSDDTNNDGSGTCDPYSWADLDNNVVCGDCKALVTNMGTWDTCSVYCASEGLFCVGAWEEYSESCQEDYEVGCEGSFIAIGTSDALCECSTYARRQSTSSPLSPPSPPSPLSPPPPPHHYHHLRLRLRHH